MIEVRVKPTRTLFYNEDNNFGIYGCDVNIEDEHLIKLNRYNNISIKGVTPKLTMNQEYIAVLKEDVNDKYEGSYIVENIKMKRPETIREQKEFLESILTLNQIENIYKVYSVEDDVVGLIERGEFDYQKVHNLGEKSFQKLQKKVMDNIDMSEVLAFCNKFGIKYNMIAKLVKEYKNPTIVIQKIEENPYLLTAVKGIGFKKADEIAKAVGYDMTSIHRIDSAIRYIIAEENQSGHSWIDRKTLLNRAIELLNLTKDLIEERMNANPKGVLNKNERFTTEVVYDSEQYVAMRMTQFKTQSKKLFKTEELDEFLDMYCAKHQVELEENQRQFFHDWNENNILLLIGGGGMGNELV